MLKSLVAYNPYPGVMESVVFPIEDGKQLIFSVVEKEENVEDSSEDVKKDRVLKIEYDNGMMKEDVMEIAAEDAQSFHAIIKDLLGSLRKVKQ